jgi:HrpA-like RNA helicase
VRWASAPPDAPRPAHGGLSHRSHPVAHGAGRRTPRVLPELWCSPAPCRSRTRGSDPRTSVPRPTRRMRAFATRARTSSLLNLWRYYEEQRQASAKPAAQAVQAEYLSWLRMREWRDVHRQLVHRLPRPGPPAGARAGRGAGLRRCASGPAGGLLGNIAQQDERRVYVAARNRSLQIFPGSTLYRKPPKWLVAGEIVETERVYARMAAAIEPEWVLDINPALLKHQYYEPRWKPAQGRAVAWRRTTLFGLTVSDRVTVHLRQNRSAGCRELLIREGLSPVAGRARRAFSSTTCACSARSRTSSRGCGVAICWSTKSAVSLLR